MKKQSDLNKKMVDRIHKFLNANNWIIAFGVIFTFVYLSMKIGGVLEQVKDSEKVIKQDIGKVIIMTNDGRILKLNKENIPYNDERIAMYISDKLQNLIQDLVTISKGFKQNFSSGKDMVQKVQAFNNMQKFFFNNSWLNNYANNILLLSRNDNYPEYINVYSKKINSFKIIDSKINKFEIKITYNVIKRSYLRELTTANKYKTEYATINIDAIGILNPLKYGNFDNPFGLKFINIKMNLLTKR